MRKLVASTLLACMLVSFPSMANDNVNDAVSTTEDTTEAESDKVDWLADFVEVDEVELKEKLNNPSTKVVAAYLNTFNQGTALYISFDDGEKCELISSTQALRTYLELDGIEIKTISFEDKRVTEKIAEKLKAAGGAAAETDWKTVWSWMIFLTIFMGAPGIMYYNRAKRTRVYANIPTDKGTSKSTDGVPTVKFSDVEGIEELKSDIMRLVDCLKNPKKYEYMGARVPKGVILYGPPGTGKTLIAKAIAGEAGVPFISAVGSDFVEKYVGVGAQRVRELYKSAKKQAPCIVFIDEIDAVAAQRGSDENSERDQTINALLAELDGFSKKQNVITICATNRLDLLDSAFQRAGRFDLKLAVGLPDKKSRINILKIHAKDKRLGDDISLESIASKTVGFSGAELEALLNEAALVAVGKDKQYINNDDIDDAFFKMVMQGNKKKRDKVTETNKVIAWHESGHTLVTKLLTDDNVNSVTIVGSASGAGGVTFRTPKEDNILHSRKYLEDSIKIMYGGRAAEELYFGDEDSITTGASQDIKQATSIILEYLALYGMGSRGMIDLTQFTKDLSFVTDEASDMAKRLYKETVELLRDNIDTLIHLADVLLEKETLDEHEIDKVISEIEMEVAK